MNRTTTFILIGSMLLSFAGCAEQRRQAQLDQAKEIAKPKAAPEVPVAHPEPVNKAFQDQARQEIRASFTNIDPHVRVNAIEAAQDTMGTSAQDLIAAGLSDPDVNVRFASAMAVGKLHLDALKGKLMSMANDPSPRVRIGVRFGLHKLGETGLSQELVEMAKDPSPRVREDVAMVFGQLGEPSGLKVLRQMVITEQDDNVRIQIAESRWRLGDTEVQQMLTSRLVSNFVDDQMWAIMALTSTKDRRVETYIRGKLTDMYIEVALVAARGLGDLGSDAGYPVAMKGVKGTDWRSRFLGAYALGAIGRSDAQSSLAPLLKDSEPRVRVAAAKALLQLREPDGAVTQVPQ